MKYVPLILQGALGFYFIQIGLGYIFAPTESLLADFARWGYPRWFVPVLGAIEAAIAVGLLYGTRERHIGVLAALALVVIMIGAVATHFVAGDGGWPLPLVLLLLSLIIARWQFPALESWLAERRAGGGDK